MPGRREGVAAEAVSRCRSGNDLVSTYVKMCPSNEICPDDGSVHTGRDCKSSLKMAHVTDGFPPPALVGAVIP